MNEHGVIMPTDTSASFSAAVERASALLRDGQVVALPTETVYGLAANALNAAAVRRIFEIKGRPATNPIIVHVAGLAMARQCASEWPAVADRLASAFWPGPITLVVHRAGHIPDLVTAEGDTVGVRWPSHPFMQAVIRECGFPLAAPSANRSMELSPTNAEHVRKSLGDQIPLIVDGGQAQVGIESTVLDVSVTPPRILRPGIIHAESLLAVTGTLAAEDAPETGPARSPGQMLKHYSPKAKLVTWRWANDAELISKMEATGVSMEDIHVIAYDRIPMTLGSDRISVIPDDAEAYARALYAELHRCDESRAQLIVVEALPERPEWSAIHDRLKRAAA